MIRLKMHAMYDHFPELNPKDGEPFIDCFADSHVFECDGPGKNIALLLEPRLSGMTVNPMWMRWQAAMHWK